jgi:hypothetical protein
VEHTCYQCGHPVEEGVAFCANCNAPQIRVASASQNEPATQPLKPGTPDEVQPPAHPVGFGFPGGAPTPTPPEPFRWQDAMPGAMLAGAVIALVLIIPLAAYVLWPLAAGALAVLFYSRRRPGAELSTGAGARVGAVAGLFAFVLFAVLMGVQLAAMSGSGKLRDQMMQVMQQSAARNPSPEAQEMIQKLMTPEGIAVMVVIVFIMFLLMFVGFSSIGGALGARLLKKREPGDK